MVEKARGENPMKKVRIDKVTLNIGAGSDQETLKKGLKLLEIITGRKPIQTKARVRLATWSIRPGLPIGVKVTIRGNAAIALLKRLLGAADFIVKKTSFTESGFSFGIKEYIDIAGIKYDPALGILGLDVCVSLERPGYRVKRKRIRPGSIGIEHVVTAEDAMAFAKQELGVKFNE